MVFDSPLASHAAFVPPSPAPAGLVALAGLFDAIGVICYQDTCNDQLAAWPISLQSKIRIIDSYDINVRLGITNVDDHGYQVTQGHAAAWSLLADPSISSVMVLEDDWTPNLSIVKAFEHPSTLAGVKAFIDAGDWGMLRMGYNPLTMISSTTVCATQCICSPPPETDTVCAVTLSGNMSAPHCDIRCRTYH
jgi:hypothetical protein